MIDKLPGRVNDRKTPLGELDWIFTAVTDTIAWNVLPRGVFHEIISKCRRTFLSNLSFRSFSKAIQTGSIGRQLVQKLLAG